MDLAHYFFTKHMDTEVTELADSIPYLMWWIIWGSSSGNPEFFFGKLKEPKEDERWTETFASLQSTCDLLKRNFLFQTFQSGKPEGLTLIHLQFLVII